MANTIVIGLTGSICTGKTTVAGIFRDKRTPVIDADKVYHKLIKPANPLYRRLLKAFGKGVIKDDGAIDRKKLADLVFHDRKALVKLNRLTHPYILRQIVKEIRVLKRKRGGGLIIIDAPLLIEAKALSLIDKLIVVKASRERQIIRCQKEFGLSVDETVSRIKNQKSLKEKTSKADYVIDNNGSLKSTRTQVDKIIRQLRTKI